VPPSSLAPSLLLAMPDLADTNFRRSVVLLVHHDEEGTIGFVLNRTTDVTARDLCESLPEPLQLEWCGASGHPVNWGGPVAENTGWIVTGDGALAGLPGSTEFAERLHFTSSVEGLRRVAARPPQRLRLFLGYSGWGPGQLEGELARGSWVVAPLSTEAVFEVSPDALWDHAWGLLGVDPATVISTPGVH
jgi:putative transcriptional regulator